MPFKSAQEQREYKRRNPVKVRVYRSRVSKEKNAHRTRVNQWKKYGITEADFERMKVEQGEVCKICGGPPNGKGTFHVDHDHKTGKIRGLLCHKCNTALGLFNDDPSLMAKAAEYVQYVQEGR